MEKDKKLTEASCWKMMGETVESPLDCKEIQPAHPKVNQS